MLVERFSLNGDGDEQSSFALLYRMEDSERQTSLDKQSFLRGKEKERFSLFRAASAASGSSSSVLMQHPFAARICITRLHYHIYPSLNQINLIWPNPLSEFGKRAQSPTDRPTDLLRWIGLDESDGGERGGRGRKGRKKSRIVLRGRENVNKLRQKPDFIWAQKILHVDKLD